MSQNIPSILQKIITEKQKEVSVSKQTLPLSIIENMIAKEQQPTRGFYNALIKKIKGDKNAVIAEIKKASPSKGMIREDFHPGAIAKSYEENGATCLSVLTEKQFFLGDELYLDEARSATKLPILRKDFIIDEYQIYESRSMGADCILLIASCLTREQMLMLTGLSHDLGMDILIEVHNLEELNKVVDIPVRMIGINNRNLHTFDVSLQTTIDLAAQLPKEILVVTESGIATRDDVSMMNSAGIHSFLVGETFMRHSNPGKKLAEIFS